MRSNMLTISRWTATVRGAAIYGIEKSRHGQVEHMSAIQKSYAILTSSDRRFEWLVRKGDLVLKTERRTIMSKWFWVPPEQYRPTGKFDLPIYVYLDKEDDDVPEWWEDGQHGMFSSKVTPHLLGADK
jgi:hypothetical protein